MARRRRKTKGDERNETLRTAIEAIRKALDPVKEIHTEMEESRDNMQDAFGNTERWDRLNDVVEELTTQIDAIEGAVDELDNVDCVYS